MAVMNPKSSSAPKHPAGYAIPGADTAPQTAAASHR